MERRSRARVAEERTIATRDPRTIITQESFSVAPELIGRPLAAPWRRAAAIGVDLLLLALLVNAGGVALGLLGGAALFRIAARPAGGIVKRGLRIAVGSVGALVLFVTIVVAWDSATAGWRKLTGEGAGEPAAPGPAGTVAEVVATEGRTWRRRPSHRRPRNRRSSTRS